MRSALLSLILTLIGVSLIISSLNVDNLEKNNLQINKQGNPFVTIYGDKFYLNGKIFVPKGVNYFPRDYGWTKMWEHFWQIQNIIEEDIVRAKALGINVVRVVIQYQAFNYSNPNEWDLRKLDRMLEILDKYNMKALVTLLDWTDPTENINYHLQHVRIIVNRYKDDPRIFGWDVRNEPDHFYYGPYRPYVAKPQMTSYLRTIISEIKNIDRNHPVSVGEYGWFLGDRFTQIPTLLFDDFNDGNYAGWTPEWGSWQVSGGVLVGTAGLIRPSSMPWAEKPGYSITLKMKTQTPGTYVWNVGQILFRYQDFNNYYAVILKTNGELELAKKQNGQWYPMLAYTPTSLSPLDWHTFKVIVDRNKVIIIIDGTKYIQYIDQNIQTYGGIALFAEGGSTVHFDDVSIRSAYTFFDNFNDGNYAGWTPEWGSWQVSGGVLVGTAGLIRPSSMPWAEKPGYSITLKMKTQNPGSEIWNVGWILFRYQDFNNYYAVILKTNGELELAKKQNGQWYPMLAYTPTGLSPLDWHTFKIVTFRNETEIYIDDNKYIYYWDSNPISQSGSIVGGIALFAEGGSTVHFDDVSIEIGPYLIGEGIYKNVDFVILHWYEDHFLLDDILTLSVLLNKPVYIQEIGRPTGGVTSDGTPIPWNENDVAAWLDNCLKIIKTYNNVFPAVWCLLDYSQLWFLPPNHYEHYFGMYRLDYSLKPHGAVYRDGFQGTILINDAVMVSQTHPTTINTNSVHSVSITVKNTGDTYWTENRGYRLGSAQPRDNTIWGTGRVSLGSAVVYPGYLHTFTFEIRAPSIPGKYSFSWRMVRESVEWFGDQYNSAIKVRDPSMNEIIDDEFVDLANWIVLQGQASISQSHLVIQSGGCVVSRSKYSDITISYRGYSSAVSGWQKSIVLAKIHRDLNNYLGFTIYGNGYAEIFYVYNGNLYSNLSGVQTNINPNEYHTYFITITDKDMRVYVDASLILSADISSYPYYNSGDYIGFYSPSSSSFIDHSAIYQKQANETFSIPTLLLVALIAMIFCGGFTKNHN